MVIPSKILAVELLVKLQVSLAIIGEGAAMTIIPLKVIQMSLTYGMSSYSPSAFAQYGNYLALIGDDFGEGCRYVKFALSLMKKVPSRAHDGITMFYSNHTKLHVEPMQSSIECYVDARKACLKSGIPFALSCSYTYNNLCLWSGKELNAVVVSMSDMIRESKYLKNFAILTIVLPMFRFAMRLMGQSDASAPQQDEGGNAGKYGFHLHDMFFTKLSEAYIFRELNKARDAAEKYFSIYCTQTNTMRWCVLRRLSPPATFFGRFYAGLVSFWVAREINDKKKSKKWIQRGVECKDEIEKLSVLASKWNFQNKAYLLQAEEQFSSMNFDLAERLYDNAISSSKTHKFVNEEALANELAGYFYLETGRRNRSVHYFSQAFEKYNEWGAIAKANTLTAYLDESDRYR